MRQFVARRLVHIVQIGARDAKVGIRRVQLSLRDLEAVRPVGNSRIAAFRHQLHVKRQRRLIVAIGNLQPARGIGVQQLIVLAEHAVVEDGPPRAHSAANDLKA